MTGGVTRASKLRAFAVAHLVLATWIVAGVELVQAWGLVMGGVVAVWGGSALLLALLLVLDRRPAPTGEAPAVHPPTIVTA